MSDSLIPRKPRRFRLCLSRKSKIATSTVLVFAMFSMVGPSATAHQVQTEAYTYWTDAAECAWGESELSHDSDIAKAGYISPRTALNFAAQSPFGTYSCALDHQAAPGYLAVKWQYYKYNSTYKTWGRCDYSPWYYNRVQAHGVRVYWRYRTPPCGTGYYRVRSSHYLYNGDWHGGALNSPYHWMSY